MENKYIDMQNEKDYEAIDAPAKIIQNGGLVLFPTETVYGIGANACDDEAVKKSIFTARFFISLLT